MTSIQTMCLDIVCCALAACAVAIAVMLISRAVSVVHEIIEEW